MTLSILAPRAFVAITFQLMNNMNKLSRQSQLNELISHYDDEHCFIREAHVIYPTYLRQNPKSTIAPESRCGLRVHICNPDEKHPGLELVFLEVEQFHVESGQPFKLWGRVSEGMITMGFSCDKRPSVVAETCKFQELGLESWGAALRYSHDNIFDEGGFAAI
jgi:hypothetical protein